MKKADQFFSNTISWCYHVLFFVTPLLFTWFNEELFEFNKMLFVYAMALIIGGLWLAQMAMHRQFVWKKTVFDLPIAFFILSQLVSTIFSIHPPTSIFGYYTRFHGGLLSTFAYTVLFAVFVQKISAKRIWDYFKTLAVTSLIVSFVAIPEHFGHSFSCILINSSHLSQNLPLSEVLSPSQLWLSYNADCWIQDVQNRVFATFGQPNWLAAFAITLLPVFTICAALRAGKERWLYSITSWALMLDLLFSKSRSGILGLVVGTIWFAVLALMWMKKDLAQKNQKDWSTEVKNVFTQFRSTGVVAAGIILLAIIFGTPYTPSLLSLIQKTPTPPPETTPVANRLEVGGTDSGEIRKIVWRGALDVWKRYPLFGSGVETFAYSYYQDRPMEHNTISEWDFLYNKAHNEFLNFLATTGLFGLITYCVLLGSFLGYPAYMAIRNRQNTTQLSAFLISVSAGVVALSVSNFFGFSTVTVSLLLFLLPAMSWLLQQPALASQSSTEAKTRVTAASLSKKNQRQLALASENDDQLHPLQWLWPGVVGLIVVLGLLTIWRAWRADYLLARGKQLNQSQQYADGVEALEEAYRIGGGEGIFAEELGETYSMLSIAFAEVNEATAAALYREAAVEKADEMLASNPHHLNFYKTRTRILAALAAQDPTLLPKAEETLLKASELAPTDPKVRYNLGLINLAQGETQQAQADFEQAVAMKPNYEEARMSLAQLYLENQELPKALDQYRYILDKIQPANIIAKDGVASIEAQIATAGAKKAPR